MKENRGQLILKERFEMDYGREELAKCDVEIYKNRDAKYEVVLTTPDFEEYKEIPVDYFFNEFATGIKHYYLKEIDSSSIKWFEKVTYDVPGFHPDYEEEYTLIFDGENYSGFDFERSATLKFNVLAKKFKPHFMGEPQLVPIYFGNQEELEVQEVKKQPKESKWKNIFQLKSLLGN